MTAQASSSYATAQDRWLALQRRDPQANSSFLYGVRSTRIYCRPTCPGRLARRANVVFFDGLAHAHRAGYRPCRRCQPCDDAWDRGSQARATLRRARALIIAAVTATRGAEEPPWTVEGVAAELGVSGGHLHRLFRKELNTTPRAFAAAFAAAGAGATDAGLDDPDAARTTRAQQSFRAPGEDLAASEQTRWWSPAVGDKEEDDLAGGLLWWAEPHVPGPLSW